MLLFTESEAKARFNELLDFVQHESVQVTSDIGITGVFVTSESYEEIRRICADSLCETLAPADMLTFTESEIKTRFNELLDHIQHQPVQVTRNNHVISVFVSAKYYEPLHRFYVAQLRETLAAVGKEVAEAGLTEQELERLLATDD
jgi:PHD/YefM family antitoxin component YafN of YafNO toxin-antitoxin module